MVFLGAQEIARRLETFSLLARSSRCCIYLRLLRPRVYTYVTYLLQRTVGEPTWPLIFAETRDAGVSRDFCQPAEFMHLCTSTRVQSLLTWRFLGFFSVDVLARHIVPFAQSAFFCRNTQYERKSNGLNETISIRWSVRSEESRVARVITNKYKITNR